MSEFDFIFWIYSRHFYEA